MLCVNVSDENDYIRDTILFLQSSCGGKVIALVLFPCTYLNQNGILSEKPTAINESTLKLRANELQQLFDVPAVVLDRTAGELLSDICIGFFSKE